MIHTSGAFSGVILGKEGRSKINVISGHGLETQEVLVHPPLKNMNNNPPLPKYDSDMATIINIIIVIHINTYQYVSITVYLVTYFQL